MKIRLLSLAGLFLAAGATTLPAQGQFSPVPEDPSPAVKPPTTIAPASGATTNRLFSTSDPNHRAEWQRRLTLGPGDTLNLMLFERPETGKREVPIGPDGRITFLQAEDVMAAGLTIDELREALDKELGKFYSGPRTIITPATYNSKKFYLLGAVSRKGVFTLNRPTTMIEAIAQAGGLETGLYQQNTMELADLSHSFMIRGGKRLPVDFEQLFQRGDLSQNIALEPNDYVFFASAAASQIYVIGAVGGVLGGTGVVPYTPNTTIISAITARGGFADKAYQSRVLVVRGSLTKPETIIVDVKAILAGEQQNFRLQPKDIVYVSRRPWARAEEILDTAIVAFLQSAVVTYTGGIQPLISTPWDTPDYP
ncbi:MAG: polysaccharide biosynthesis/export family protein [Verrucomicrobiota bacterium]